MPVSSKYITHTQVVSDPRLGGDVVRYHTWPTIQKQTVASHTWNVMRIYCQIFGLPPSEVFYYMLHHDTGEMASGDIPFYAKRQSPKLKSGSDELENEHREMIGIRMPKITDNEWARVKLCDMLEMDEFAKHEVRMGNGYADAIRANISSVLTKFMDEHNYCVSSIEQRHRISDMLHSV